MARFGLNNIGFFGGLSGGSAISGTPYGSFYDTTIQSALLIDTAYAMKLNTSDSPSTSGVIVTNDALGNPTQLKVSQTGVYNLQFSVQILRTQGGTTKVVDIWLRKNGNTGNIPNTNTSVSVIANSNFLVPAWNFFISLQANDFLQLMWATNDTDIILNYAIATSLHPATPSLILTMNRIS